MVRIVTVDRTKASAPCSPFDGAQSDPSRLGGEAGREGLGEAWLLEAWVLGGPAGCWAGSGWILRTILGAWVPLWRGELGEV